MTKVKICGLSTPEAVQTAVEAGADYIGFVFAPSKRQVTLEQARQLATGIPKGVQKVGVFVSPQREEVEQACQVVGLDLIQVHGPMDDTILQDLPKQTIRAVQVGKDVTLPETSADYLLFDAPVAGSGETFNWQELESQNVTKPFFIAGGLTEDNVADAIRFFHPYAVDVSSGVETNGKKDQEKIKRFIERVSMAYKQPDKNGFYGRFGGRFVPETLMTAVLELEEAYRESQADPSFQAELDQLLKQYVGRETPLYYAKNLTKYVGGAKIFLKREDLNHTGAHKINNALGQVLLAHRMGKKKIIAETGAGQHGVATATAAALFDMECTIYMGEEDVKRQALNVFRMELLGAKVQSVTDGSRVLKDAVNAALRAWVANVEDTHYIMGSALGPHPFPEIVRDFQSVIGREAKRQFAEQNDGALPDAVLACVGGGSNAIGLFYPFVEDTSVAMYGAEAAGLGVDTDQHAATLTKGRPGVLHGALMDVLQDAHGQILEAFSISAGLDYPGIGPEHSYFHEIKRATYVPVTDQEALEAFQLLSKVEGIIPALESSHAIAYAVKLAKEMGPEKSMIVCLSGRGDKDVVQVKDRLEQERGE